MRAIDTNIVVRFLTNDDPKKSRSARKVIEAGEVFIASTVLLESEWVLRSGYGAGLRGLAGLPGITVEEPIALAQALAWTSKGMDFADALHLAKSRECDAFLTFDRKLRTLAKTVGAISVRAPA